MSWFRLRPTFDIEIELPRQSVIEQLQKLQNEATDKRLFMMFGEYGELHLPTSEHRLWSPHLSFYVGEVNHHTVVHGRFAPRVDIWTIVWIAYLVLLFSAFFGAVLGISQWTLGELPWGLWIAGVSMVFWLSLFVIAHVGQQLSSDQMHLLQNRLKELLASITNQRT